jgi:hypothetical protein
MRMKNFILPLFLLAAIYANGQYITNPDFENWTSGNPDGWQTSNSVLSQIATPANVTQEITNPYTGTSDIKLTSVFVALISQNVPGLLTNGQISINTSNTPPVTILGGTPFVERPNHFKGYFRYTPGTGDYCQVTALLLKKNTQTNQFDTVAAAQFVNTASVSGWTLFDANFVYKNGDTPDTLQIIAVSSNPSAPVAGSVLYLDHLYLSGGTISGIQSLKLNEEVQVYPNPAEDIINVYFGHSLSSQANIVVYNSLGQKVKESIIPTGTQLSSLNVYDLKQGLYFVQITFGKERFVQKIRVK